jgi:hypothetical protein
MNSRLPQQVFIIRLGLIAILWLGTNAQAAVFCSLSSAGFANGYVPTNITTSITPATFSVTCSRDNAAAGGPTVNVRFQVAAGNGSNASGTQNRAARAGSFLNYHVATDAGCATPWKGATLIPTPQASIPMAKNSTVTANYTFYGCIPPGQLVLPPEGMYTDTVAMTFSGGGPGSVTFTNGTFPVNIIAPASCNITTPPASVAFTYTAFSPTPVLANASFGVRCTTSLAYSMALDATFDVVAGLNYTLALNTTGNTGGLNPLLSVGTGITQTFFINGNLPAGQAGTCNSGTAPCTGSQVRTLTVTY